MNSLINLKIKENETKKYKIEVSQLEINNNLKTFAPDNLDNFIKKFESNNLNFEIFKKDLKTELAWRKLIYYFFNKKIKVNDSEINLELNKILKDSRKKNKEFRLTELVVNFENQLEKNKKIKEISEQINITDLKIQYSNIVIL